MVVKGMFDQDVRISHIERSRCFSIVLDYLLILRRCLSGLLMLLVISLPSMSEAASISMRNAYKDFRDSFGSSSMEFGCGDMVFRLDKGYLSSPKIHMKERVSWVELDDLKLLDTGFEFLGFGWNGPSGYSAVEFEASIPFRKEAFGSYFKHSPIEYFEVIFGDKVVPYKHVIDVYESELSSFNMYPIEIQLKLNGDAYRKDQYIEKSIIEEFNPEDSLSKELARKRRRNNRLVDDAIKKYGEPFAYTVRAEKDRREYSCYML